MEEGDSSAKVSWAEMWHAGGGLRKLGGARRYGAGRNGG